MESNGSSDSHRQALVIPTTQPVHAEAVHGATKAKQARQDGRTVDGRGRTMAEGTDGLPWHKPATPGILRRSRRRALAGGLGVAGAAAVAAAVGALALNARARRARPVPSAPPVDAGDSLSGDRALVRDKLAFARAARLHALPRGEAAVRLGLTFAGTPYAAGTLEAPGPERLVVNLRELDCVTFVESALALARVARVPAAPLGTGGTGRTEGAAGPASLAAEYRAFEDELGRWRYRGGELGGYASRLHYFSEWIADAERKGLVRDLSRELGGVEDPRPITFMSAHPEAYPQLAEPETLAAVARHEAVLSARRRFFVPRDGLEAALPAIENGDVLAATTSVEGLDVVHTAFAYWQGADLHLLHAPSAGSSVQVSRVPVPEWMRLNPLHTGLMVARPV